MVNEMIELISVPIDGPAEDFWKSLEIFLFNPRTTSKNVAGIDPEMFPILAMKTPLNIRNIEEITRINDVDRVHKSLQAMLEYQHNVTTEELREILRNRSEENEGKIFIWIVKILYKNIKYRPLSYKCYILDFQTNSLVVIPLRSSEPDSFRELSYKVSYSPGRLTISTEASVELRSEDKTREWLKNVLCPRIQKWMQQELSSSTEKSLKLINCEEYNNLYNSLKLKYGKQMIEVWPEVTDPAKYVYEDVAIASYLLLIWKLERQTSGSTTLQSFVDLGCGNGLLVYILTMEGHPGFGIDLRKRTIWDMYPKEVDLRVETIVPSDANLYPTTDWIIGNHSDELSPWVPVIAARSSAHCRFFLLPCCAYEFSGQKFQRRNSKLSQYLDFMEYAKEISLVCGYAVQVDRLKIPSTKRICLIGYDRSAKVEDFSETSRQISEFINKRANSKGDDSGWSADFKPRETVEAVKNCTKLEKSLIENIVELVFKSIISEEVFETGLFDGKWNVGRGVQLSELAGKLSKEQLSKLKAECGGLQTLLKNHHHVFEVKGGTVKLRIPESMAEKKLRLEEKKQNIESFKFQQRPCFYFHNHPQGCPLVREQCTFKHE